MRIRGWALLLVALTLTPSLAVASTGASNLSPTTPATTPEAPPTTTPTTTPTPATEITLTLTPHDLTAVATPWDAPWITEEIERAKAFWGRTPNCPDGISIWHYDHPDDTMAARAEQPGCRIFFRDKYHAQLAASPWERCLLTHHEYGHLIGETHAGSLDALDRDGWRASSCPQDPTPEPLTVTVDAQPAAAPRKRRPACVSRACLIRVADRRCSNRHPRACTLLVIRRQRITGWKRNWLLRIPACESHWNPQARNPSGASGLYQFMPGTWRSTPYGRRSIWHARWQAHAAAWMIRHGRANEWECK